MVLIINFWGTIERSDFSGQERSTYRHAWRRQNHHIDELRKQGIIVFIDRPLEHIASDVV